MIAVDTNILVHAHRRDASFHEKARSSVRQLAEAPRPWCLCYHSLVEFYGVVTYAKLWSTPSTPEQAAEQILAWSEAPTLRLLTDKSDHLGRLLEMARAGKIAGPMIHDARIAVCCLVNGIRELWTIDRDFSRFPELRTRNPLV